MGKAGGKKDLRSREERRRQTGEDFTPIPLVNEMLDLLPADEWKDPNQTFLDPACGDGNFLVEIKKRLLAAGHSEENALSRIYGVDIMHDNVVAACERLGVEHHPEAPFAVSRTIICADTLQHDDLPSLFAAAVVEFHCDSLKSAFLKLKPFLKSLPEPDRSAASSAWKEVRKAIVALRADGQLFD